MRKVVCGLCIIVIFSLVSCSGSECFDVLIAGGTIYDGTQADPYVADIGIKADRIVAIGQFSGANTKKLIDARGLTITPGFIDVHNHTDINILREGFTPEGTVDTSVITPAWRNNHNYSTQGVTTIVTGLCGAGFWDVDQWLGLIESQTFASNVYHMVPYGMLRMLRYGDDQPEPPLPAEELEALKNDVEERMKRGAIGVSVGLEYAPDCFTSTDELVEIAKVVDKYGGLFDAHIRDQTGPGELTSIRELIEIGKRASIPVHISHIQVNLPWEGSAAQQMLDLIEQARAGGVDITADQHPYERGYAIISYRLPTEYKTGLGVKKEFCEKPGRPDLREATAKIFEYLDPDKIRVISNAPEYLNMSIAEIANSQGKDPIDVYVDFCCMNPAPNAIFDEISGDINREIMPHDYVFTASDGFTTFGTDYSPHPRFFGCFPRKVKVFSEEEKLMTVKSAIRSMTSLPAVKFKIKDRGLIAEGKYADIAVIDLENFADKSDYTNRSEYSVGVIYLLVNGVLTIDNGTFTGNHGGRPLRLGE